MCWFVFLNEFSQSCSKGCQIPLTMTLRQYAAPASEPVGIAGLQQLQVALKRKLTSINGCVAWMTALMHAGGWELGGSWQRQLWL